MTYEEQHTTELRVPPATPVAAVLGSVVRAPPGSTTSP